MQGGQRTLRRQVKRPSVRNFRATSVSASAGHGSNQIAVVQLTSEGYIPEIHSQRRIALNLDHEASAICISQATTIVSEVVANV